MTVAVPEPAHLVTDLKTLCLAYDGILEWRPLGRPVPPARRQPPAEYLSTGTSRRRATH